MQKIHAFVNIHVVGGQGAFLTSTWKVPKQRDEPTRIVCSQGTKLYEK
jgi:hypothetical protein